VDYIGQRKRRELVLQAQVMRVAFAAVMSEDGAKAFGQFVNELQGESAQPAEEGAGDREFKRRSRRLDPDKLPAKPEPNPAVAAALEEVRKKREADGAG